jgi:hypothetical protein
MEATEQVRGRLAIGIERADVVVELVPGLPRRIAMKFCT